MKKLMFIMVPIILLFAQCKKDDVERTDDLYEKVPVTFELPKDMSKSDFTNLLPDGNINWGNENNIEYIYLAVADRYSYYSHELLMTMIVGELFELTAEVTESTDRLVFSGMIPKNLLWDTKRCTLYYFGNNGNAPEGSNVTNIYDVKYTDCVIGKTVSFAQQTGDVNDLGDYHIASIPVKIKTIRDEERNILGFDLIVELFNNNMSIAMLDLEGETVLGGSATAIQSYTLKWEGRTFEESYDVVEGGTIDVTGNVGEKSLIALLPNNEPVTLECSKGKYTFHEGLPSNTLFIGNMGHDLNETTPLPWEDE